MCWQNKNVYFSSMTFSLIFQIQEVDESATSSRNSIDNLRSSSGADGAGARGTPMMQKKTIVVQQIKEDSDNDEQPEIEDVHEEDEEKTTAAEVVIVEKQQEEESANNNNVHEDVEYTSSSDSSGSSGSSKHSMQIKISDSLNNNEPILKARITRT